MALVEGDNSFTATASDGVNTSDLSPAIVITLDTIAPSIPTITTVSDTTNTTPTTIAGTADADSIIDLYHNTSFLVTQTADSLGNWQFTSVALVEGDNSFTATASDGVNTSDFSPATIITLDTINPLSPLSHHQFEDNLSDSTGNGNFGTINIGGTEVYVTGVDGKAFEFDSSSYITLDNPGDTFDFDVSDKFSVAFWIKKPSDPSPDVIMSDKATLWGTDSGWVLFTINSNVYLRMADGSSTIQSKILPTVLDDTWHHVVVVWTGGEDESDMTFYVDGAPAAAQDNSANSITTLSNTESVVVGTTAGGSNKLNGPIDDLRIYGFDLSSDQVDELFTPLSPLSHHQFEDNLSDSTGNGNFGTINIGGTEVYVTGVDGKAFEFDSSSYITLDNPGDTFDFDVSDKFSVAFWIKKPSDPSPDVIMSDKATLWGTDSGWVLFTINSNVYLRMADGSSTIQSKILPTVLDDTWHHVVVVWTGGEDESDMTFYVDGAPAAAQDNSANSITTLSNTESVVVGTTAGGSNKLNGPIDDLRIYGFDLSSDQVDELFILP